jgi:hypothetical protein
LLGVHLKPHHWIYHCHYHSSKHLLQHYDTLGSAMHGISPAISWSTSSRRLRVDNRNSVSAKRDVQHLLQLRMQVAPHWTDYSQWRYHNCSSCTRALEKLTRYRVIIETVPTEGFRKYFLMVGWIHTTICGIDICFQTIVSAPCVRVRTWCPCFASLISGPIWR